MLKIGKNPTEREACKGTNDFKWVISISIYKSIFEIIKLLCLNNVGGGGGGSGSFQIKTFCKLIHTIITTLILSPRKI